MNTDLEPFLTLLHASPPDRLGALLQELLSEPISALPRLEVFVPEVSLMLTRLLVVQDWEGASRLANSLWAALPLEGLEPPLRLPECAQAPAELRERLTWLCGRLMESLVLLRRLPMLETHLPVREGDREGRSNGALLRAVAQHGPVTRRSLRQLLSNELPGEPSTDLADLHSRLSSLVHSGHIELDTRTGSNRYRLTPRGQAALEARSPFEDAVARAYAAHRQGLSDLATPFARTLLAIFQEVDRAAGLLGEGRDPGPAGSC